MKITDYIKNGVFETTLQFFKKDEILHFVKISKKYLENHKDTIEIFSKTESCYWEDYYECNIKILKDCYFIYKLHTYSDYDSHDCDIEYTVENIVVD